jgi:hypothetical protein
MIIGHSAHQFGNITNPQICGLIKFGTLADLPQMSVYGFMISGPNQIVLRTLNFRKNLLQMKIQASIAFFIFVLK